MHNGMKKPGCYGSAPEGPLEGVAEDTARWRGAARHDDVAEARGRRPPSKKLRNLLTFTPRKFIFIVLKRAK